MKYSLYIISIVSIACLYLYIFTRDNMSCSVEIIYPYNLLHENLLTVYIIV